jgi:protease I
MRCSNSSVPACVFASHLASGRIETAPILPARPALNRQFSNQIFDQFSMKEDEMAGGTLEGKRVAILATDGFEQIELLEPRKALDDAGATTMVISPKAGQIRGWSHTDWGNEVAVDNELKSAKAENFHALLLPGGVMNPDRLRMDPAAVAFVKHFADAGKPIAAICHGPWTLIEAGAVMGHTMTSWPSLKTDLKNAGANWVDKEVVSDGNLVTSRKPDDIPAFNREMVRLFSEDRSQVQNLRKTA